MTRRTVKSLWKGDLYVPERAPLPSSDAIAMALVLAGGHTGELASLKDFTPGVLLGVAPFRARWIAYAALLAYAPGCDPRTLGRLLGCDPGGSPELGLEYMRGRSWFCEDYVQDVFNALAATVLCETAEDAREAAIFIGRSFRHGPLPSRLQPV